MRMSPSAQSPLGKFLLHRSLITQFISRDFSSRYKGSHFGILWSVLLPLLMVAMYTFVFGFIFRARWGAAQESKAFFGTALFAGLIPFNFFCEVITVSATLIHANANLVKKVVFPLEILPLSRTAASAAHAAISLAILAALVATQGLLTVTWLYLPLVLLPFIAFCCGLSYLVSALSVFIRDITHVLGTVVSLSLFLSPIFYSSEAMPEFLRPLVLMNPLALVAEQTRRCAVFGLAPDPLQVGMLWVWGGLALIGSYLCFQRLKDSFADVV